MCQHNSPFLRIVSFVAVQENTRTEAKTGRRSAAGSDDLVYTSLTPRGHLGVPNPINHLKDEILLWYCTSDNKGEKQILVLNGIMMEVIQKSWETKLSLRVQTFTSAGSEMRYLIYSTATIYTQILDNMY